jgi:hypothetical protein
MTVCLYMPTPRIAAGTTSEMFLGWPLKTQSVDKPQRFQPVEKVSMATAVWLLELRCDVEIAR